MRSRTTISYGPDPSQFGVLSIPSSLAGLAPVVVLIHGGFWRATYDLHLMDDLADDLAGRGFAAWNVEYRRVGQPGGGWPGTLADAAAAVDAPAELATAQSIDLRRVAVVGHSAGGHLALWSAGRELLPPGAPGHGPRVVPAMVIGLGPVGDLRAAQRLRLSDDATGELLGGPPTTFPDRYDVATPRIPTTVTGIVVRGTDDDIVPADCTIPPAATHLEVIDVPGDDHFDLIDPTSASWASVVERLARL